MIDAKTIEIFRPRPLHIKKWCNKQMHIPEIEQGKHIESKSGCNEQYYIYQQNLLFKSIFICPLLRNKLMEDFF